MNATFAAFALVVTFGRDVAPASPISNQTKLGCVAITAPNWSNPWAIIVWLAPVTFSIVG